MRERQGQIDRIYLDHAATTPLDPAVFEAMRPYLRGTQANPSSLHASGRRARAAVDRAREQIAQVLAAQPAELVFTSGGTEACNLAVYGAARAAGSGHVIVSAVEHHAVLLAARRLRVEGFNVTELPVDADGLVDPDQLASALTAPTILVSIGMANNEIGTVQDIPRLVSLAHDAGAVFHTDAVQAAGQLDINVDTLGVDLLSMAAHKFYGPKGIGALYLREGVRLEPLAVGGTQEFDRRAGTENLAGMVGMAAALVRAHDARPERVRHYRECRDALIDGVLQSVPDARLTGHRVRRLPSIASFAFKAIEGESLVINLDLDGIDVSTGAACTSGSVEPSHVTEALGLPNAYVRGSLRCSVGVQNTAAEMRHVAEAISRHADRLQALDQAHAGRPEARQAH